MTEKLLLRGKRVKLSGTYEALRRGKDTGRKWTMVQEIGSKTWKPAWVDELEEIPDVRSD